MTEDDYHNEFRALGFALTGLATNLTEQWERESDGCQIVVTKASELSPEDRAESVEYIKRSLGIGYPIGGGGVH